MSRPTARVLALLELLQSTSRTRTLADLAARLGVDERTVRRYLTHLTDLDVPVESVRGRYGGVRLAPGYRMPPLMLTDEEAVAVLLGLVAGAQAGLVPGAPSVAETAAAKVRRVLPAALARRVDALVGSTEVATSASPVTTPQAGVLLTLAAAVRERRPVALDHTSPSRQQDEDVRPKRRTVHPYGLVAHRGRWYLSAADAGDGAVRTYRVDRVTAPTPLAGRFDVPAGLDPTAEVLSGLARTPWRHEVRVRVRGAPGDVAGLFPAGLAATEEAADVPGWTRAVIRAEHLHWVPGLLASLPVPFVVEGPEELQDLVRTLGQRLAAATPDGPAAPGG